MNRKHEYNIGDIHGIQKIIDMYYVDGKLMAKVKCIECGKTKSIKPSNLFQDRLASCVCKTRTHGFSKTKLYGVYANIKYRCYNSNHHEFYNYGGKGIKMSPEWLGDSGFENFRNWAIAAGYKDGLTIDRIDSNKDYEPSNCQWITRGANTTKSNKIIQHRKANKGRYYGIDPDGNRYEFDNANQFAKEHDLNAGCVRAVANGTKKTHKKWVFGFMCEEAA